MKTSSEIIRPFALYQYKLWVLHKIDLLCFYKKKSFIVYEKKNLLQNLYTYCHLNLFSSKIWFGTSDSTADLFMEKTLKYTGLLRKPKKEFFFASEMGICRSCVFSGRLNFKISNNVLKSFMEEQQEVQFSVNCY